jgi:predicted SAM-dependent methyltransferase
MRAQWIKDLYFTAIQPVARINHWRWERQLQQAIPATFPTPLYLNLGSGANPIPDFVNIEGFAQRNKDMWLDLRNGLPFPDKSVDGIFTCHVFEHFYMPELAPLVKDCYRVLKPGGVLRILVPSVEKALAAYANNDDSFFTPFPRAYKSMGGKLYNFLLCEGQHRIIFDFSLMDEMLRYAGFSEVRECAGTQSAVFSPTMLEEAEGGYVGISLIVEASA